jgi:sulfur carrier protein
LNTIRVTVNGTEHVVASTTTLAQLLGQLGTAVDDAQAPVASAVNGHYVARQARAALLLRDRDAITTFEPITGG